MSVDVGNKIGEFIKLERKIKGLTQKELAGLLYVSNKAVSKWETGDCNPDIMTLTRLSEIFECTTDDILNGARKTDRSINREQITVTEPTVRKPDTANKASVPKFLAANKIILLTLGLLPLLLTLAFMPYFPPKVPAHYDIAGNITRFGNKFVYLLLPIANIFLSVVSYLIYRLFKNRFKERDSLAVLIIFNFIALAIGTLTLYLLIKSYNLAIKSEQDYTVNFFQASSNIVGVVFIILGIIMPFIPVNPFFGLRTSSTMGDTNVWKKSHQAAGIIFIITGTITVIFNTLYSFGSINIIVSFSLLIVAIILSLVVSGVIAKKI